MANSILDAYPGRNDSLREGLQGQRLAEVIEPDRIQAAVFNEPPHLLLKRRLAHLRESKPARPPR
jgi:hypothetical protein